MVPAPTAETSMQRPASSEWFPVVEPTGIVTGRAVRQYCHSGAKPLHPVIHIHIIDRQGRLYLQKRSIRKDIQPGKWDTAVGGHIDLGESVAQALVREVHEELGIGLETPPTPLAHYVFESERERELVFVHKLVYSGDVCPSEELDGGRFWSIDELREHIGKQVFTPNFESEYLRFESVLRGGTE